MARLDDDVVIAGAAFGVPPKRLVDAPEWADINDVADRLAPSIDQATRMPGVVRGAYRLARSHTYRNVARKPAALRLAGNGRRRRCSWWMTARPLTCLIVDDSPQFLDAARQLLADDGVNVVGVAATSDQAVDRTAALRPDVALIDVELGSESGFDVARRLARLPHGGPPVVLISAESGSELAELVDGSGALGFVSKTDLSGDAIRTLLARTDSGR